MKKQNVRMAWYLAGALVLGLAVTAISCGMIEPPSPPLPVATISPPLIPHSIEGRADCRVCHATGVGGAPQFPSSHSERPSDVCLTCHQNGVPAFPTMPPPTPPAEMPLAVVSARDIYATKCAVCHGANRQGVPGLAPALTPQSLMALGDDGIKETVRDGRPGTAMTAFAGSLSPEEIEALLQLIKSPVPQ